MLVFSGSERKTPVFHLSYDRKDLALRVTVSNTGGDDAYEAKLLANFSGVLSYSGFRSPTAVRATNDTLAPSGGCFACSDRFSPIRSVLCVVAFYTRGQQLGFKHLAVGVGSFASSELGHHMLEPAVAQ